MAGGASRAAAVLRGASGGRGRGARKWRWLSSGQEAGEEAAGAEDGVLRSLKEAARAPREVVALDLSRSPELVCLQIACAHVGEPCVCRLSRVLERLVAVRRLDLSSNNLHVLPETVTALPQLRWLDISGNPLAELPAGLAGMARLETLVVDKAQEAAFRGEWGAMGAGVRVRADGGGGDPPGRSAGRGPIAHTS